MATALNNLTTTITKREKEDPHALPQYQETFLQLTLLIAYIAVLTLWLFRHILSYAPERKPRSRTPSLSETNGSPQTNHSSKVVADDQGANGVSTLSAAPETSSGDLFVHERKLHASEDLKDHVAILVTPPETKNLNENAARFGPEVTFDKCLSSVVLFGAIMIYFYICDYRKVFEQGERIYSRDQFLFLVFLFFLVSCCFTLKSNSDKILNRDQTEEWKGWMQVMFVWYHYFKAKEWYNWIRVYIACYVWMTGFGNFSFFWVRNDYSLWRFVKMMFRLNFMVFFVAMVTNNAYMLYYICAMHTYWFLSVFTFMRVLYTWNRDRKLMALKFAAYAAFNAVVFEIPGLGYYIFRPLQFLLGLRDGSQDVLHEWIFRAGLDHWACLFGMLCAYNYPHFEALMHYLDSKTVSRNEKAKKEFVRVLMGASCLSVGFVWYFFFMSRDKYGYNAAHPYSSCIPILIYIVLRNIHPFIRSYHLGLFAWLGKITLETYLSQIHIYLISNARTLLVILHGYPLLNFSLTTIIYLLTSHTMFTITNNCSLYFIPRDYKRLLLNLLSTLSLFGASALMAFGLSYWSFN